MCTDSERSVLFDKVRSSLANRFTKHIIGYILVKYLFENLTVT